MTWELDHKEGWVLKNRCFRTVVLEKTLESPLDNKEIKPINPKGNQHWISIGRTDAEAEVSVIWLPDGKSRLVGKDPDAGKDWRQEDGGRQRTRWLDGITNWWNWVWANPRRWWKEREAWRAAVRGVAKSWRRLNDWTRTINIVVAQKMLVSRVLCYSMLGLPLHCLAALQFYSHFPFSTLPASLCLERPVVKLWSRIGSRTLLKQQDRHHFS